jgi:hypothetical protein
MERRASSYSFRIPKISVSGFGRFSGLTSQEVKEVGEESSDEGISISTARLETLRHPVCDDYCVRL